MSACTHPYIGKNPCYFTLKEKPEENDYYSCVELLMQRLVEVVEMDEAANGKGRACPVCGGKSGAYICDGFATFQGLTVLPGKAKE